MNKKQRRQERAIDRLQKSIAACDAGIKQADKNFASAKKDETREKWAQIKDTLVRSRSCAMATISNTLKNLGRAA